MSATDSVEEPLESSGSFWDTGNYKPVLKRINQGAKLCDELVKLAAERSAIEKAYNKSLVAWADKWEKSIPKSGEYGTLKDGWDAVLIEARQMAAIHLSMKDKLEVDMRTEIEAWKKEHYQKSFIHYKTFKRASAAFEKAQAPWVKRKEKIDKHRNKYEKATQRAKQLKEEMHGEGVVEVGRYQAAINKEEKLANKAKQKLKQRIDEMLTYTATYRREMEVEFDRCQEEERERIEFFKKMLLKYHQHTNLTAHLNESHNALLTKFQNISAQADLDRFDHEKGTKMPMVIPDANGNFHMEGTVAMRRGTVVGGPSGTSSTTDFPPAPSVPEASHPPPPYSEHGGGAAAAAAAVDPDASTTQYAPGTRVRAIYDYAASREDELSFAFDDVIIVQDSAGVEPGWIRGKHDQTGNVGIFPGNYIELEDDDW